VSGYRGPDLYAPPAIAFFGEPSFRFRVYLGAAACRRRAHPVDFHQLSWRAAGRPGPNRPHDYQSRFGRRDYRLRVLSLPWARVEFSTDLADFAVLEHSHRFPRRSRRRALGV